MVELLIMFISVMNSPMARLSLCFSTFIATGVLAQVACTRCRTRPPLASLT